MMNNLAITDVAVHCILLITGLFGNIFILTVHFLEWLETREQNPCNLIINAIGIFNICLQIASDMSRITVYLFPDAYLQEWVNNLLIALASSVALSSLWCSTCLCCYYCVKIVNSNGHLFYKLKARLPVVVPWLLVFSVTVSWSVGMPAYWDLHSISAVNTSGNATLQDSFYHFQSRCKCMFYIYSLVASMAFAVMFWTSGAIIISLCKHMSRMRQNNERHGHSRLRAHLSAAKTVTALLLLYLIFYGAFIYLNNPVYSMDYKTTLICLIVISIFPAVNSIILIMGNRKLLNNLKRILRISSRVISTEVTITTL